MAIYIGSFIFNMLLGLAFCISDNGNIKYDELDANRKKRKLYLIITALQLGIMCGLRSSRMAYDTGAYELIYNMSPDSWEHIFDKTTYVELGFQVLCSIIKILGGTYQTMLIFTSLFVMGSCCTFIYRHSKDVILSVFIIISFPFFYSSFDIIRHFVSTSFFLLGYKYVVERKPIRYIIFIAMGSLFHSVVWLFLPFYFFKKVKLNWLTVGVTAIFTTLLYIYIAPISEWVSDLLGKSSGVESGWVDSFGGGIRTALMYATILMIAWLAFNQLSSRGDDDMTAVNYVMLMLACSIVFINARMMTRMIMTMVSLLAIAIPQLFDRSRISNHGEYLLLKFSFIVIGCAYHIFMLMTNWQNVVPYIPFWR